ncbi:DMT family transporter [Aminipila luticellarii]|uniref:Multidrug efflux SMR transporter n=1 Tax=Aminipila luticellarii TaxID=2507160 RepID=A0A410PV16_9FIRM|nr:SMR family transporter [Aminipila luticellarii]QAT42765.1 multidrug efflux SMR transporter [Aminipila luticellarii]
MLNVSKPVAYLILGVSIVLELCGSACLEACGQFADKKLTVILILCYLVSFGLFSKILHLINLAVGYATWTGVGAIATSLMGVMIFDQPLTIVGWISIFAMGLGVFILNLFGTPPEETPTGEEAEKC